MKRSVWVRLPVLMRCCGWKAFLCSSGTRDIYLIKIQNPVMIILQIKLLNCASHLNVIRQHYMFLKESTHSYSVSWRFFLFMNSCFQMSNFLVFTATIGTCTTLLKDKQQDLPVCVIHQCNINNCNTIVTLKANPPIGKSGSYKFRPVLPHLDLALASLRVRQVQGNDETLLGAISDCVWLDKLEVFWSLVHSRNGRSQIDYLQQWNPATQWKCCTVIRNESGRKQEGQV